MGQVTQKTQEVSEAAALSGAQWRSAGMSLGRFGQAMTNILVLTNLLPGSLGNVVNKTLLLATTTINAVYAVSQLVRIYQELAKAQRIQIVLQSILAALGGPVSWGRVALGVGAGVALGAGALAAANKLSEGGGGNTYVNNFNGPTNEQFAREMLQRQREMERQGR